jgi:uncharacterized membrane protein
MSPQTQSDLLTRTTFQLNKILSPLALGQLIAVLHRVPGVLLAEIATGANRLTVAHDAGVSSASVVDAAARTGVGLKLVLDTRPAARLGAPQASNDAPIRNLVSFAVLIAVVSFLGAIISRLAWNQLVLPIVLGCVYAFVICYAMFKRRPHA